MYNHEAPAHRKLILRSLLICWLIILGGYLLIRMVFLVFGLQLHLTAQGICLALLPYCFGALYLWKRCKKQKPWFYVLGLLLPAVAEKLTLYFLGAYLCGHRSRRSWQAPPIYTSLNGGAFFQNSVSYNVYTTVFN